MNIWSFFDPATGHFTGRRYGGSLTYLQLNTPEGMSALEGEFDHLQYKVLNGAVVDYQPPAPPDDEWQTWAWDAATRRNLATPTLAALKRDRKLPVLAALAAEDARIIRPTEEITQAMFAGTAPPAGALAKFAEVLAAKQTLREQLAAIDASTE